MDENKQYILQKSHKEGQDPSYWISTKGRIVFISGDNLDHFVGRELEFDIYTGTDKFHKYGKDFHYTYTKARIKPHILREYRLKKLLNES